MCTSRIDARAKRRDAVRERDADDERAARNA
jgi:hypothetical protein